VASKLSDYTRKSGRLATPDSAARRERFGQVYRLGLELSDLRRKHGLTQTQLAKQTGIDQADISRIESGSTLPNAATLERLALALDAEIHLVERSSRTRSRS